MTSAERRSVASLALLYAFRMLGLFMVLPVLALYAEDYSGSTPLLIGLALGIYGLSQAGLQIPLGMLSDRIGRKPVIVGGLLLFGAGSLLAASADSIGGLIAGRFLQGAGAIASTLTALLADLTRDQHRSKAMAALGASIGLSFTVALILSPLLSAWLGLSGLFGLTAALAAAGIVIVLFVVPTPQHISRDPELRSVPALLRRCLGDRDLLRLDIGIFALHFSLTAIFVVVPGLLEDAGLLRASHWQVYLPIMLLSFVAMVPLMIVAERRGRAKELFLGAVTLLAVALLGGGVGGGQSWGLLAALFGYFLAFNLLEANLPSLVSKTVYPGGKGTAMGVYSTFQFAGAFCGGASAGAVAQHWGAGAVFALCALVAALWLVLAWGMRRPLALTSYAVDLGETEETSETIVRRLRELPGVLDITVVSSEKIAYLRVSEQFDQSQLSGFSLS